MNNTTTRTSTYKEEEVPHGLHQTVMRRVNYLTIRPFLIAVIMLFIANLLIISSHINNKLVEAEFIDMAHDLMNESSIGFFVVSILLERFFEVISSELLISLFLNITGTIYLSSKLLSYKLSTR